MNKKVLIGVGIAAVAGIAYYMYSRGGSSSSSTDIASPDDVMNKSNPNTPSNTGSETTPSGTNVTEEVIDSVTAIAQSGKEGRQARRQLRRDCRAEAKAKGLKGKAKRDYKRKCKAEGGFDSEESSDFAFNGHQLDIN